MELTPEEIRYIYIHWQKPLASLMADTKLRAGEILTLKEVREASLVSVDEIARRMGVRKQAYAKFESETDSLKYLARACRVLNCELKVTIAPLDGRFIDRIWNPLFATAKESPHYARARGTYRAKQALVARMNWLFQNPRYRRERKWNREIGPTATVPAGVNVVDSAVREVALEAPSQN